MLTETSADLYLDLLKRTLTGSLAGELVRLNPDKRSFRRVVYKATEKLLAPGQLVLARRSALTPEKRAGGGHFEGETMLGLAELDNLQECIGDVIRMGVPGDLIETGVWRGGATILMRAVLKTYGDTDRVVWVADSFQGLPKPDAKRYPADSGSKWWRWAYFEASLDEVKRNFAKYELLDDQVRFLVGWFRDTLPTAPIEKLAILRLDGDMYESTMDALTHLYPKVSPGGYVIIDDYGAVKECAAAVDDYRGEHGIDEEMMRVGRSCVFWQRWR